MPKILQFLRSSGIFLIGSVLTKIVGFLLLPLYTKWIAPDDLGYYDVSLAFLTIACEALFLNIWVVILRFMYDYSERRKPRAFAAGMVLFGISAVVYLIIALVVFFLFHPPFFWLIVSYGLLQNVSTVFKFTARGYGKNLDFALSGVLSTLVMAGLNILLVGIYDHGIEALYFSMIVGFVVEVVYLEIRVGVIRRASSGSGGRVSKRLVSSMARYAIPIGLNALCYWFIQSFNKVVISQQLSLFDNGIFSVAARFGGIVALATVAMTYAWQELAFDEENQTGEFLGRAASYYLVGLVALVSVMLPFVRIFFDLLIDPAYGAALYLVPSAVLLGVASGYSNFVVNIFYGLKQSKIVLLALFASALVNIGAVYLLINWWGLQGANLAGVLAFLVNVCILHGVLWRRLRFRFSYLMAALAGLIGAVTGLIYFRGGVLINLIFGVLLVVAVAIGAAVLFAKRIRGPKPRRAY